jgi:hypothetical protein
MGYGACPLHRRRSNWIGLTEREIGENKYAYSTVLRSFKRFSIWFLHFLSLGKGFDEGLANYRDGLRAEILPTDRLPGSNFPIICPYLAPSAIPFGSASPLLMRLKAILRDRRSTPRSVPGISALGQNSFSLIGSRMIPPEAQILSRRSSFHCGVPFSLTESHLAAGCSADHAFF